MKYELCAINCSFLYQQDKTFYNVFDAKYVILLIPETDTVDMSHVLKSRAEAVSSCKWKWLEMVLRAEFYIYIARQQTHVA